MLGGVIGLGKEHSASVTSFDIGARCNVLTILGMHLGYAALSLRLDQILSLRY